MNEMIKSLIDTGLSEKEAITYLTLTKFGKSNVKKIASKSGLKRPTVYVILDELRKKGYILELPSPNKSLYEAKDPDEIMNMVSERYDKFKDTYRYLKTLKKDSEDFNAFYYEGSNGIKEAFNYKIETLYNSEIISFGAKMDNLNEKFFNKILDFDKIFIKNNITFKGITVEHPSIQKDMEAHPETYANIRILPMDLYTSDISIEACGEFVRIIDFKEEKAVIIDSHKFSDSLKNIYRLVESGLK
jgi:sugar-specific transcriptional regulator TrmB